MVRAGLDVPSGRPSNQPLASQPIRSTGSRESTAEDHPRYDQLVALIAFAYMRLA